MWESQGVLGSARTPGIGAIVVLGVAILLLLTGGDDEDGGDGAPAGRSLGATVTRVVDGDTIEVAFGGETEDVRYIGIDTPESVAPDQPVECFGRRASALNARLVEGADVRLVFDAERRDRYGRLLAYVYVGDELVNAELVRRGLARTLTIPPNTRHADRFARLAQAAGNAGRGLWGACGP
jgi:micrococcal nuclease